MSDFDNDNRYGFDSDENKGEQKPTENTESNQSDSFEPSEQANDTVNNDEYTQQKNTNDSGSYSQGHYANSNYPYNNYNQNQYQQPPYGYPPTGNQSYNNFDDDGEPSNNKKGMKIFFSVLIAVFILAGIGLALSSIVESNNPATGTTVAGEVATGDNTKLNIGNTPNDDNSVAVVEGALTPVEIADSVKPSVVGIIVYSNTSGNVASEGSGIIMSEDNSSEYTYIITCAHVISSENTSISVQLADQTTYDAELVGYDSRTDVGVVKIKATGLTAAVFGDSNKLKVGEPVYAIGNPGGTAFFGSFTGGMVSAIDRSITSTYTMVCIQHDAAINPGNSGGALVNAYGQVIGINSLKIADSQYEGMGFAIPIFDAKSVVDDLIAHGYVPNRPKLGISYSPASSSQQYNMIVQIKGLPSSSLIIMEIDSESGLAGTDARKFDLIIGVDGKEMNTADVLLDKIDNSSVGDTISLTLCRISNNYEITTFNVNVKLVEDKGSTSSTQSEEGTTQSYNDFFSNPFGF